MRVGCDARMGDKRAMGLMGEKRLEVLGVRRKVLDVVIFSERWNT